MVIIGSNSFVKVSPFSALKPGPWTPHENESAAQPHLTEIAVPGTEKAKKRGATLHDRLTQAEKEIQALKSQISTDKASWEMRFTQLQKRQQNLRDQLTSEILVRDGVLHKFCHFGETNEIPTECGVENSRYENEEDCSGGGNPLHNLRGPGVRLSQVCCHASSLRGSQISLTSDCDLRSTSAISINTSLGSWRGSCGPHRVFVPHSPMDLRIGHRVRILLPSGRISTGTLRYLGHLDDVSDLHLGVELESAENGEITGTREGHCYFECKPGYGAFVAFNKLLMAWE